MEQDILRPRRRRRNAVTLLCIASPLVLCLGWSALWLLARREAGLAMEAWMADEAGRGRQWTCPDRQIGGFPLQLIVDCTAPTYHGKAGGDGLDVKAAGLTAFIYLYQPRAVTASLAGPVTIVRAGREDAPATLTWKNFTIEARILDQSHARVALTADEAAFEQNGVTDRAAHAEIRVAPASGAASQNNAYEVWTKLDQASVPLLDALTGDDAPASFDQKGILTEVSPSGIEYWPVLVDAWRRAGGVFDLSSVVVTKGEFHAEAKGRLGLDEAHRLTGRLQTALSGYEAVAGRFGISPRALSVGNALSNLLTGKAAPPAADKASIKLPLVFSEGRIAVGPVVIPQRLVPLY